MRGTFIAISVALGALLAAGCIERPTDQELDEMCRHLEELRGEVDTTPIDETLAELEKDFTARLEKLQKATDEALAAIDAELQAKLDAAGTDEEKAKLNEEYAPKKDQAAKENDKAMQDLATERTNAVQAAKDKAEAGAKQLEENVKKCKTDRISSDISKETAQCRIKAQSVDAFWNKCM